LEKLLHNVEISCIFAGLYAIAIGFAPLDMSGQDNLHKINCQGVYTGLKSVHETV